jgi:hypothetical protein
MQFTRSAPVVESEMWVPADFLLCSSFISLLLVLRQVVNKQIEL